MSNVNDGKSLMRRLPLLLLLMGLVILLVWAGLIAYHAYSLYQTATQLQDEAQILSEEGLSEFDFDRIEPLVLNARRHFSSLHSAAGPLYGILPYLSWVPKYGPLIAVAPDLMEIGDAGTYAAVELVQGLKPAAYLLQNESGSSPGFFSQALEIVGDAEQNIQNALAALEYMNQSRDGIEDIGELPWRVRTLLDRYDQEMPLLEDALRLSTILPDLLGMDGRKNYLIMAQNEDEIRPTGGFISGAGLLVVEDGQILSISFGDANEVDDYLHKPYDFPPMPFNEIMGMDIFLFRDANYWPNFPESAESAMELYTRGQDVPLDGVIAINQRFIQELLSALGPLFVPEIEQTLSTSNVIDEMRNQWRPAPGNDSGWIRERKAFMGPIANAIRQRIESDIGSIDLLSLLRSLSEAADRRDMQIYLKDSTAAKVLSTTGWDGHFENSQGQDYLLVVDMSLGFNKVSAIIDKEINYHVTIPEDGEPTADLLLRYAHQGEPTSEPCHHGTSYMTDLTYSDLFEDCYWNYVRVYVPAGSQLVGSSNNPVDSERLMSGRDWGGSARVSPESNDRFTVFDSFYLVEQGQQVDGEFFYAPPSSIVKRSDGVSIYSLEVAKQAGIADHPLSVWVSLPEGAEILNTDPEPSMIDGNQVVFDETLVSDMFFEVVYR